jgi:hypothetical protein
MAHIYDYAIIGSGLTGLSIAAALSRETTNIALIEAADVPCGVNKIIQFPTGPINNGIRFAPDSVSSENAISFLEILLTRNIAGEVIEESPITYDSGNFKTFLGFGDNPPAFYEELAYFTANKRISFEIQPYDWTQLLFEKYKGEFFPRSYVTKFHEVDGKVSHLTINGTKTIQAHNFIFAGSIKDLAVLLPEDSISIRARTRLAKSPYWTAICLDICHSHVVTESKSMHVLNGTTQDEIGPCAGQFLLPVEVDGQNIQSSQWITFIEHEVTEDSETIGVALKKIKRQIKRAYPTALDNIKIERIFVAPIVSGNGELKLNANMTLPNLSNLWIASATINENKNLIGAIHQAKLIISSLGFSPQKEEPVCPPDLTL